MSEFLHLKYICFAGYLSRKCMSHDDTPLPNVYYKDFDSTIRTKINRSI